MPRSCCVVGCHSSADQENKRSLFKFPENPDEHKKWHDIVLPHIRQGKGNQHIMYICDAHFTQSSFYDEQPKILKDGVEVTMSRQKKRLKPGSAPSIFYSNQHKDSGPNNFADESTAPPAGAKLFTQAKKVLSEKQKVNSTVVSETENVTEESFVEPIPKNYSITDLVEAWKSKFPGNVPQNWGMIMTPQGAFFTYVGDINQSLTNARSLLVRNDMSVEIQVRGRKVNFPILDKVVSFQDLVTAMTKITCLKVCAGANCAAGFYVPLAKSCSDKCKPCQKESRRQKDREKKQQQRRQLKLLNENKSKKNFQQKYRRSLSKISQLEENIDNLIHECAKANEKAIEEYTKNLTPQMKEAVQMCYRSSQIGDKRGLRYTKRWILECLLLIIKSRKAYLHLKDHNILALPSLKNTIRNKFLTMHH